MIVLLPLLGITWVFGLLAIDERTIAFQYIFAILNSLQVGANFLTLPNLLLLFRYYHFLWSVEALRKSPHIRDVMHKMVNLQPDFTGINEKIHNFKK